jgi:hypothetical protein
MRPAIERMRHNQATESHRPETQEAKYAASR